MTQFLPDPVYASADEADVAALLGRHHAIMRAQTPEESCHVMEGDTLQAAGAQLFALREAGKLLGIGAFVIIAPGWAEIKSMHTSAEARGCGVGRRILRHMLNEARSRGVTRVSLETGSADAFAAARGLYLSEGFAVCPPFGVYSEDPLSVFMTRTIG